LSRYASDYQTSLYPAVKKFNRCMKGPRTSVEHLFGRTTTLFPIIANKYFNLVYKSPVDDVISSCYLLTNIHNFCFPNQIAQYFGESPITIEQYFHGFTPPPLPSMFVV